MTQLTLRTCPWCGFDKPDVMPREIFNVIEQVWEPYDVCGDCYEQITNENGEIDQ